MLVISREDIRGFRVSFLLVARWALVFAFWVLKEGIVVSGC